MSNSLAFAQKPRPWSIDTIAAPDGSVSERLRVGLREIAIADIVGIAEERISERDSRGLVLMAGLFGFAALVFLIGVADLGWRTRFLIGAVFLAALALASVGEISALRAIGYRRLLITTRHGATLVFTSADDAEVDGLSRALGVEPQS